jgi:phosphocarrier protein
MVKKEIIVKNKAGLHARPISNFVNTASKFNSDITITKDTTQINGKSILNFLTLAAGFNTKLILTITGEDENEAMDALATLLEGGE